MGWRWRVLVRRLRDQAAVLATVAVVALVATTLLGTYALLLDGTQNDALDEALHRADDASVRFAATLRPNGEDPEAVLTAARDVVADTLDGIPSDEEVWRTGPLVRLPRPSASGPVPLGYVAAYPAVAEHGRLVTGSWPDRARDEAGRVPVAVPAEAAEAYGWQVGTVVPVSALRDEGRAEWVVVGTHELGGPRGVWERDRLDGRGHDGAFVVPGSAGMAVTDAWGPAVVDPSALTAPGSVENIDLVVVPRLAEAPRGAVGRMRAAVPDAPVALAAELRESDAGAALRTRVDRTVDGAWRELAVTRVGVVVVGLLLTVLATTVMLLAARLLGERRAAEAELLAARGAAPAQLRSLAVLEATLLLAAVTLVAPWCARALYGALVSGDLLGSAGFTVPAGVPAALVVTTAAVAAVLAVSLVVPQWHAAGSSAPSAHAGLVRAGADLALVALAGVALWQLLTYGSPFAAASAAATVDPVLAGAPALVALGAAVLALRLVPLVGRAADRLAARGRTLVAPLAAWQVARRPAAATGAVLVLVLAIASATFAQSFLATWRTSQLEQTDAAVGTDVRLEDLEGDGVPGARRTDGVLAAHPDVVGVPVVDRTETIGQAIDSSTRSSAQDTRLLAVDTTRPEVLRGRTDTPWPQVVAALVPPDRLPGVPLPGDTEWVVGEVTVEQEFPVPGEVGLSLVVEDANGVRTWVTSTVPTLDEPFPVWFRVPEMALPVQVVGLSARLRLSQVPPALLTSTDPGTTIGITIASARTLDRSLGAASFDDTVPTTPLPLGAAEAWQGNAYGGELPGKVDLEVRGSDITVTADQDAQALTGDSVGAHTTVAAWEGTADLHAVITADLAEEVSVGADERLLVSIGGIDTAVRVAAVVPYLPGSPRGPGLLVDSDALSRLVVRAGSPQTLVDAWWFGAPDDATAAGLARDLRTQALGEVTVRADERVTATSGPLRVSVPVALSLVGLGAGLLVVVGLGASASVAVRTRRLELARLQALGSDRGSLVRGLLGEHALLVAVGALSGVAIGFGLAQVVAPVLTVSGGGLRPVPAPVVAWPWSAQLLLVAALATGACLAVGVVAGLLVRRASGALLRLGDDR